MIVVSDTTPLRYLIEIEEVQILEGLFGEVVIPEKVSEELQRKNTPAPVKEWMKSRPAWLEVRQADISLFTPKKKIQDGERQAIALAIELKAGALLIDDGDAIKEAHRLNLPTVRLFNILERAAEAELLDLPEAIGKMKQTSFHLPPDELVEAMLERDRQRKQSQQQDLDQDQ